MFLQLVEPEIEPGTSTSSVYKSNHLNCSEFQFRGNVFTLQVFFFSNLLRGDMEEDVMTKTEHWRNTLIWRVGAGKKRRTYHDQTETARSRVPLTDVSVWKHWCMLMRRNMCVRIVVSGRLSSLPTAKGKWWEVYEFILLFSPSTTTCNCLLLYNQNVFSMHYIQINPSHVFKYQRLRNAFFAEAKFGTIFLATVSGPSCITGNGVSNWGIWATISTDFITLFYLPSISFGMCSFSRLLADIARSTSGSKRTMWITEAVTAKCLYRDNVNVFVSFYLCRITNEA